ncbi:lipoprotein [Klebsiella pneumoniae]|nr:lipoprotein [Klebsiella pneumoniae]
MSEITETHTAWVPPPFPPQGRLPGRALQVGQNCHQQNSDERRYHQELCLAAGRRVEPPCCKTLHISLFFDGTGNNLNHDFFIANPKHPTNIAIQPEPGKPKLTGIKLYVYGFSRGAAAARTFVRWLSELLPPPAAEGEKPPQCLQTGGMQLPVSVEFLGLLDTVASVGVAHVVPVADGHMSWADGTMELPDDETYGGLIKKCVHLVSGHEQRLCFPLDSVRRANGKYPPCAIEVVYPGMHSDIGGGYPPGEQGKGNAEHDGHLLSQIVLHDMYSAAFNCGAPLKVPKQALPEKFKSQSWRVIPLDLDSQFFVSEVLSARFNAWRELTLGQTTPKTFDPEAASHYEPPAAGGSLETVIAEQMAWITAWRIDRYARGSMLKTPFYQRATNTEALPAARKAAEVIRDKEQEKVLSARQNQIANQSPDRMDELVLQPGVKDFDPKMDQTQLFDAAKEFGKDYHDGYRIPDNLAQLVLDTVLQPVIFVLNTDDEAQEYRRMKRDGEARVAVLFPDAGEASNAEQPAGLVRALFDDQVHDSRAWFMYAALGTREMWTGYFRYRMIYFSERCSKPLSPLVLAGDLVGFATVTAGVVLSFRQKRLTSKLAGLAATGAVRSLEVAVLDQITGEALPELPGGEQLRAFTHEPGTVVAQQKARKADEQLARGQAALPASWLEDVLTTTV